MSLTHLRDYLASGSASIEQLAQWEREGHLAYFYYATRPEVRYGYGKPPNRFIADQIKRQIDGIAARIELYAELAPSLSAIVRTKDEAGPQAPYWENQLLPVIDAVSIVGMAQEFKSRHFVEMGSGNSTRFAMWAHKTLGYPRSVTSVDAYPGGTIEAFPHNFIKEPVEATELTIFTSLEPNDILWVDGSHRSFSNTDATVFFLDVLPRLKPGVIVGVHDIPLPWDYPPGWEKLYFNEQFLMGSYLVGAADTVEYLYPAFHINVIDTALRAKLQPIWDLPALREPLGELGGGGAFWFRRR